MQRDKVLGLSLAILLIGFAGAFCFRNETSSIFNGPQLQNPRALDDAISDKEGPKPYVGDLQGAKPKRAGTGVMLEGIEADTPFATSSTSGNEQQGEARSKDSSWELPDFLKAKPGETQRNLSQSRNAPAPITAANQNADGRQDVWIPKHNQAWETSPNRMVSSTTVASKEKGMTHIVSAGDTLTGLAARYLGHSSRYREIYDANRDVLQTPNDLRAGMTLRIPQIRAQKNSVPQGSAPEARLLNERGVWSGNSGAIKANNVSTNRRVDGGPANMENPRDRKQQSDSLGLPLKQFVPVKRSPFVPKSSMSEPATKRQRSLSQIPPAELPDLRFQYYPRGQKPADSTNNSKVMAELTTSTAVQAKVGKHTVKRGETLESIALQAYGSRAEARKIFDANRDRLRSPNGLREGTTILLP